MFSQLFRFIIGLTGLLLSLILVACQPISPLPTAAEDCSTDPQATCASAGDNETLVVIPSDQIVQNPNMLAHACSSLMDTDLKATYATYPSAIFWTFHMNFREFADEEKHIPIACLRFYWRDDMYQTFTTTASSDLLIPCMIENGDVTFEATRSINSSLEVRSSVAVSKATFLNGAYISCPLDLRLAIHHIVTQPSFLSEVESALLPSNIESVMAEAGDIYSSPTRTYDFFTMAAVIESLVAEKEVYPLAYYAPRQLCGEAVGSPCANPTQLSLFEAGGSVAFEQTLDGTTYTPISVQAPSCNEQCGYRPNDDNPDLLPLFIWADYGLLYDSGGNPFGGLGDRCQAGQNRYVQFVKRINGQSETCSNQNLQPTVVEQPINFWMGPSTVYVGYQPYTGQSLQGSLYEVWIDPDHATPPTNTEP